LPSDNQAPSPAAVERPAAVEPVEQPTPRPRWRPSILLVLLVGFGGLTVAAAGTVTLTGYEIAKRNTYELVAIAARNAMGQQRAIFNATLDPAEAVVRSIAGAIERRELDPSDARLTHVLEGAVMAAPQLGFVAYVDSGLRITGAGRVLSGLRAGRRSVHSWPDLRDAVHAGETQDGLVWRGPSFVPSLGTSFVLVTEPVRREGRYLGLAVAGVAISGLSMGRPADSSGTVDFVLRDANKVLAHPALAGGTRGLSADHPVPRIGDIGDPVLAAYAAGLGKPLGLPLGLSDLEGESVTVNGESYVLVYYRVAGYDRVDWRIGRYFPESGVAQIQQRLSYALVAGGIAVIVALLFAVALARLLARGIGRLADAAQRVARLEFETTAPLPGSLLAELDRAAIAFNAMRTGLAWFETYVPRKLVKRLLRLGDSTELAPVERELTVIFTDIVGFTAISQRLSPARLAAFINRHFALLAAAIEAEGGTLDKYIGDSVMAFWGAPATDPEHATHACRAALAIAGRLRADNERRRRKGFDPVRIRIGIHSGRAVAGNIGAPGRINYTLIGDTVNVAQRLEQLAKEFDDGADTVVIASASTLAAAPPDRSRSTGSAERERAQASIRSTASPLCSKQAAMSGPSKPAPASTIVRWASIASPGWARSNPATTVRNPP
jgi:adenylate cyclase